MSGISARSDEVFLNAGGISKRKLNPYKIYKVIIEGILPTQYLSFILMNITNPTFVHLKSGRIEKSYKIK